MRLIGALIRKEILLLTRDWHGLALLFVLPAVFICIMSLAMQDAHELGGSRQEPVRVLDLDDTDTSRTFVAELNALEAFRFQHVDAAATDRETLADAVQARDVGIALILPEGFSAMLQGGQDDALGLEVLHGPGLLPQVRELFALGVEGALTQAMLASALERLAPSWQPGGRAQQVLQDSSLTVISTPVYRGNSSRHTPNAVQQSVPAWLVFAMYFIVSPLASSLIIEREQGTLARLRQLNVPAGWVLGGRVLPYYAVNMVQLVLMLAVGVYLVPLLGGDQLTLGGSPAGLWVIASANSLAAIGFALLIASLSKTLIQATLLGGVITLIMGALGGIMVPKAVMPPGMQAAANLSPMSWGLEGFWHILLRLEGAAAALPEALALAGFGMVCWTLAAILHRRNL